MFVIFVIVVMFHSRVAHKIQVETMFDWLK